MTTDHRCRWVCRRLPLLAGGELGMEERRKVERHLIGCGGCRDRRDASISALAALRSLGDPSPSEVDAPTLWPALARQIRESKHASPALHSAWWDRPLPRPWALAGLATAIGVVLGASVAPPSTRPESEGPSARSPVVAIEDVPGPVDANRVSMAAESEAPEPPRRRALPDGPRPGELTQAPLKPIEPPSSILRFDYDLDHGTPMTPGTQDPQRTF